PVLVLLRVVVGLVLVLRHGRRDHLDQLFDLLRDRAALLRGGLEQLLDPLADLLPAARGGALGRLLGLHGRRSPAFGRRLDVGAVGLLPAPARRLEQRGLVLLHEAGDLLELRLDLLLEVLGLRRTVVRERAAGGGERRAQGERRPERERRQGSAKGHDDLLAALPGVDRLDQLLEVRTDAALLVVEALEGAALALVGLAPPHLGVLV